MHVTDFSPTLNSTKTKTQKLKKKNDNSRVLTSNVIQQFAVGNEKIATLDNRENSEFSVFQFLWKN